jgi:hypothetical protein
LQEGCKKSAPSIEGYSPFHEPTKSKGLVAEEVQFFMSQIYLSSKKGVRNKEKKNRGPNLRLPNTCENFSTKKQVPF